MPDSSIPMECRTYDAICNLSHDNVCQGDFYMLLDGEHVVVLGEHPQGGDERQKIRLTRDAFDEFVKWYTTGEVPRGDKASRTPKRSL